MSATTTLTISPKYAEGTTQQDAKLNIQVLRGIACVAVIWHHVGDMVQAQPTYQSCNLYVPYGNVRPLLFFMLSGFVIGVGNKNLFTNCNWFEIKQFIRRRFLRIYPIYAVVVLFTFFVTNDGNKLISLVSHLLFAQSVTGNLVTENSPLWTMNFEILYYTIFIVISFLRISPLFLISASTLTGVVLLCGRFATPVLISYCFGLSFWGIGLFSARYKFEEGRYPTSYFISLVLLILCYQQVEAGSYFINKLPIPALLSSAASSDYRVRLTHLQFAPVCFLILYSFNNKKIKYHSCLLVFVYLPPLVRLAYLAYSHKLQPELLCPALLFIGSAMLLIMPFQVKANGIKKVLRMIGDVSYSLYLIHFPIACLCMRALSFADGWMMAVGIVVLYLGLTYLIAYLLEKHYQGFAINLITNVKLATVTQWVKNLDSSGWPICPVRTAVSYCARPVAGVASQGTEACRAARISIRLFSEHEPDSVRLVL